MGIERQVRARLWKNGHDLSALRGASSRNYRELLVVVLERM